MQINHLMFEIVGRWKRVIVYEDQRASVTGM
jgi:hypothetical protein